MPIVNNQGLQQQGSGFSVPYAEFISRTGNTANASMSWGSAQAVRVLDFYWSDLDTALREALGDAYRSGSKLKRTLPNRHPIHENLYCTRVSNLVGVRFDGKEEQNWGPTSKYQYARLTLVYEALPFNVLNDSDLQSLYNGNEWERYTTVEYTPAIQVINRQAGTLQWSETSATGPDLANPQIPFGESLRVARADIKLRWHLVPEAYVLDSSYRLVNALNTLGKVNDAPFLGHAAGTLLLGNAIARPVQAPFPVAGIAAWKPQRLWTIEYALNWFDPPPGTSPVTTRGHNLLLYSGDHRWYKAVSRRTGTPLYESADFTRLFAPV